MQDAVQLVVLEGKGIRKVAAEKGIKSLHFRDM